MKLLSILIVAVAAAGVTQAELQLPDAESLDRRPVQQRPARPESSAPALPPRQLGAPPPPLRHEPVPGTIRFRNGDFLHGVLNRLAQGEIEWAFPEAKAPLRFSADNAMQITLAGVPTHGPINPNAAVNLTNGDTLRGTLVALDHETLTLDTWFAGQIKFRRAMLRRVTPLFGGGGLVWEGISSLEGWKRSGPPEAWQLRDGVLVASQHGAIGRDLPLPERCSIEFDMAWSQVPVLFIGIHNTQPAATPGDGSSSGYWVNILNQSVQLQRGFRNDFQQVSLGTMKPTRPGKVRLGIRTDKARKAIAVYVDGQLLKAWTDPGEWAGDGTCLTFGSQIGGAQTIRISNLRVTHWTGELTGSPPVEATQQDVLCLANQDRVNGRLESIRGAVVTMVVNGNAVQVPLERIADMYFAGQPAERARRMATDVMALFHDGGRVTVALESLDPQTFTGESENFGKLTFQRAAFRELQLHLYDEDRGDEIDIDSGETPQWSPGGLRLRFP